MVKEPNFTKYTKPDETLDLQDDAAHIYMVGDWHMPTHEQAEELLDNTIQIGVGSGFKFVSFKDPSKYIFIPKAGLAYNGNTYYEVFDCYLWSSMLDSEDAYYASCLDCEGVDPCISRYARNHWLPIRGVIDNKCDNTKEKKII